MENKSHTGGICCSGAKIIRIPRGRQRIAPKMDKALPEVGDVILYNEKISEGMRTRGHVNLEKRGCMHITSITSSLVYGEAERIVSGSSIKKMVSLNANDIRMGKVEYVKLSSGLIPENLYENRQLELLSNDDMGMKISKLPNELKEKVIV